MNNSNFLPSELSDEDNALVMDAIKLLMEKLFPHLISLTPEERMEIPKMGDKSVAFVSKNLDYSDSNPDVVPPYVDKTVFKNNINRVSNLRVYYQPIEQLCNALSDTIMLSGSEAYSAALSIYNSVKDAAKRGVPGAQTIYEDLRQRFPSGSKKK